jgi:hypothetical protein
MDPRVATAAPAIREQFDLSMACHRGLGDIQDLVRENRSLRGQIAALSPTVVGEASRELRDSLASLDHKLAASEGGGPPNGLDIIYTTVRDGKTMRETLNGVQTRLLYVMLLLQAADAQPTDAQKSAVRDGEEVVRAIDEQWKAFKGGAVADVNRMLKQAGLDELKVQDKR